MLIKPFNKKIRASICNFSAFFWVIIYLFISLMGYHVSPVIFMIIFSIFIYFIYKFENPAHYFWCIGFFSFVSAPVIGVSGFLGDVSYGLLVTLSLSSLLFLQVTKQASTNKDAARVKGVSRSSILKFCCACGLALFLILNFSVEHFIIPLLLVYLYYLVGKHEARKSIFLMGIFALFIAYYIFFEWSGFGRVVIAVYILGAFWIYWQRYGLPFGKIIGLFAVLVGPLLLGIIRGGYALQEQIQSGDIDSNLSPYLLANDLRFREMSADPVGLLEQFFLYFFMWIPRAFWEGKPYGFGFEYTVQNLDQSLIDAGHSIASLFVSEHIYYLGSLGLFTALLSILLVAFTYNYFRKLKNNISYFSFIVALHMPTFVWGGLASYSARVWMPLLSFSLLIIIFYSIKKYSRLSQEQKIGLNNKAREDFSRLH